MVATTINGAVRSNAPARARVNNPPVKTEGDPEGFRAFLAYRRKRAGLSIRELAAAYFDGKTSTVGSWENEKRPQRPGPRWWPALCAFLEIDQDELFARLESDRDAEKAALTRQIAALSAALEHITDRFDSFEARLETVESRFKRGGSRK